MIGLETQLELEEVAQVLGQQYRLVQDDLS